jgi:hypothetical protein
MRFAHGFFAVACSFALIGSTLGQAGPPDGAFALPPVEIAPANLAPPATEQADIAPVEAPQPTQETLRGPSTAIEFEAQIIHLSSPEEFAPEELAVTAESVDELLQSWNANGKVARMATLRLTTVNEQEAFVHIGEQVPVTTARASLGGGRGGPAQTSIAYQDIGLLLGVRGRLEGKTILIECNVEESRLETASPLPASVTSLDEVDRLAPAQDDAGLLTVRKWNTETVVTLPDGGKAILSSSFQKTPEGSKATIITLRATTLPAPLRP